tara:strand:+ start:531 stop:803 length:273 start_codon:yes stop_codon:yes gene_type:complete
LPSDVDGVIAGVGKVQDVNLHLAKRVSYDGSNRQQYIGDAKPGTATSAASWRVRRISYDGNSYRIAAIEWAEGDNNFDNVWDNRASLSYS